MLEPPDFCVDCNLSKIKTPYGYACGKCGRSSVELVSYPPSFIPNVWLSKRKSKHSRIKWMERRIKLVAPMINSNDLYTILQDFTSILQVLQDDDESTVVKPALTRYNFYVIRIISRNKIVGYNEALFRDLNEGRRKDVCNDTLFGHVYPKLGWDVGCECPIYNKWMMQNKS